MSRFQPRKATRSQLKARVALDGPSGAGKTYTAIEWGQVLQGDGRTVVIDTENGSAEWYSDRWDYDVVTWSAPYNPGELADAIKEAAGQYSVIVVDSFSHFWEGEGGTLDIVDAAGQRSGGNSFAGWKVGTPALRHLIDTVLSVDAHVIATMRSKMEYVLEEDSRGKKVPKKVGLAPVMRAGVEYEFTLIGDLDLEHRLVVSKSRCSALADLVVQPGRAADAAHQFLGWLEGGEGAITAADAETFKAQLNEFGAEARRAWLERFGCKPDALPVSRLEEAQTLMAGLAPFDPPPGGGDGSSGADGPVKGTGVGVGDASHAAGDPTPQPELAYGAKDVARYAAEVFREQYDAAPARQKTKTLDRLRHSIVFAETGGRATSLNDLEGVELHHVHRRLQMVADGQLVPEVDEDGVTFVSLATGTQTRVTWAQLETKEAA